MHLFKGAIMIAAIAAAVSLAGCATVSQDIAAVKAVAQAKILNPLNDKTVLALGATDSAANSIIITYGALELCPAGQPRTLGEKAPDGKFCHDKALFKTLYADAVVAFNGYDELATLQQTHPTGSVLLGGSLHDKFVAVQGLIGAVTNLTNAYVAAQASSE